MNKQKIKSWLTLVTLASTQFSLPAYGQAKGKLNPAAAATLSVSGYIEQVREKNQSFVAAQTSIEGASLRSDEYKLLTRPNLIGSVNYSNDEREAGSALQPVGTQVTSFSLGVQQQFDFGLAGSVTYNHSNVATEYGNVGGLPPGFLPETNFYTSGPALELSLSLWRNGAGRETRATQELLSAQVLATRYSQSFRQTQLLADAEVTYWSLSIARERVAAAKESVERAKRQQEWSAQRTRVGLTDRSDLLQANAAFLQRQLELQSAMDAEKAVSRQFNTVRGVNTDVVPEVLPLLDVAEIEKLSIPTRVQFRDDVKAAEQQKRIAEANSRMGIEKNKPTVNLVGSLGLNGRDTSSGSAISESFGTSHPNYAVGVRLNMPLDLDTLKRDREGYAKDLVAADFAYQRTVFEQERLWNDFLTVFKDSIERYRVAAEIEKAQLEKLDYERNRHRRGRTTTALVIMFEGDVAMAQFARRQAQSEVLNAYARLKTFGGGQ